MYVLEYIINLFFDKNVLKSFLIQRLNTQAECI